MALVPPGVRRTVLLAIRPPAVLLPGLRRAWAVLASIRSPVLSGRRRAPVPPASIRTTAREHASAARRRPQAAIVAAIPGWRHIRTCTSI
jgi:hypothetical protein